MLYVSFTCAEGTERSKQYLARRQAIDKELDSCWQEERELHDLDIAELEESVFRFRKREVLPDIQAEDGRPLAAQGVRVALPIADFAKYAPTER